MLPAVLMCRAAPGPSPKSSADRSLGTPAGREGNGVRCDRAHPPLPTAKLDSTSVTYHRIGLEHEILVQASAEAVYELVSDITRTGEWSPECVQAVWTYGEPGVVGSRFVGSNYEHNPDTGQEWRWDMTCEVLEADAARTFAWTVLTEAWDLHTSVWRYEIEDLEDSVLLRHRYRMKRPPKGWQPILDRHSPERQLELVEARRQRLDRGMRATLQALAAHVSSGEAPAR